MHDVHSMCFFCLFPQSLQGVEVDLSRVNDPNTVAGLLKLHYRELRFSIVPRGEPVKSLIAAAKTNDVSEVSFNGDLFIIPTSWELSSVWVWHFFSPSTILEKSWSSQLCVLYFQGCSQRWMEMLCRWGSGGRWAPQRGLGRSPENFLKGSIFECKKQTILLIWQGLAASCCLTCSCWLTLLETRTCPLKTQREREIYSETAW